MKRTNNSGKERSGVK